MNVAYARRVRECPHVMRSEPRSNWPDPPPIPASIRFSP